jgi:nucleosome binding factor SPN SPT16 subunit
LSKELEDEAKSRLLEKAGEIMKRASSKDIPTCYKQFKQMDADQYRSLKIYVDKARGAVVFPIYGMPVPFHVAYIKQVTIADPDDDGSTVLRVTFDVPGVTLKPEYQVRGDNLVYMKELCYRSKSIAELTNTVRKIKELQKKVREAVNEEKQQENYVEQEELISAKAGDPKIVLKDLFIKPNIGARGKRVQGTLQAHRNGFLFTARTGEKIKILYSRIKHALFQPPDDEVVIMHVGSVLDDLNGCLPLLLDPTSVASLKATCV